MAKVYVVGGIANDAVRDMFKSTKEIEILGTFPSILQLTEEVIEKGVSFLHLARAVLILDYGFTGQHHVERAKEFVLLQDALNSSSLSSTKLYLATKDSNLYVALQHPTDGLPSLIYLHTEVMLLRGEYVPKTLNDIIQGRHDLTGLYHPDVVRANKITRMEDDRDKFIADSKTVDNAILHYGKDEPISPFSQKDYVDSAYSISEANKREQERKRAERMQQAQQKQAQQKGKSKKRKKDARNESNPDDEIEIISFSNTDFDTNSPVNQTTIVSEKPNPFEPQARTTQVDVPIKGINLDRLKENFKSRMEKTILSEKLAQDSGVLVFTGTSKSGASGILANCADIYALNKRQVLIIDLDIENRMQLNYFPQYMERVQAGEGVANSLIQVIRGGAIPSNAVKLTSRIDMLAVHAKETVEVDWWDTLEQQLEPILTEAQSLYDIVLVDLPFHLLPPCEQVIPLVSKFVCVTTNKIYELETLLERLHPQLAMQMNVESYQLLLRNMAIWINQYRDINVDRQQYVINRVWLRNTLHKMKHPYDKMQIVGESPFYEDWEQQFHSGVRYIWQDKVALGVFQQLLTKVVW